MQNVVLVVHLMIAAALVGVVLLQRSEGGALGMGGSASGGFMTGRGTANMLTRATAGLAAAFFVTSITLTLLAQKSGSAVSPLDARPGAPISAPATPGAPSTSTPTDAAPAAPGGLLESLEKGKAPLPKVPRSQ